MKKRRLHVTLCLLLLLAPLILSSCSLFGGTPGDDTETGYGFTEEEIDVSRLTLEDLKGKWVDVNSETTLEFRGKQMTVRSGEWSEDYTVKLVKNDYAVNVTAVEGYLGMMSELTVNKDGSLTAYEMILDGPSNEFRFVREPALEKEKEILDLSRDLPKVIESREIESFSLSFQNSHESYGLDADWASGYYSWEIELLDDGTYQMSFQISGDSYIVMDYREAVDKAYVTGLADLIAEKDVPSVNGYYMKNNVQSRGIYLYAEYLSGETLSVTAEGDAAKTCPFDLPALLEYAFRMTGKKGWDN